MPVVHDVRVDHALAVAFVSHISSTRIIKLDTRMQITVLYNLHVALCETVHSRITTMENT